VLGFTANAQPEEIQRCKQAGMDDCLFKPLTLTALSRWVEGMESAVLVPAFSLDGFELMTGGNPVLTRRLLTELLNSNRLDRQGLLGLSESRDPQAFRDIAHKIKGAARIVQASRLIDTCEALEAACRDNFHPEKIAECCRAIEHALLELDKALLQQLGQADESKITVP
jgi:two-component system sensor histidine kinase EvgS